MPPGAGLGGRIGPGRDPAAHGGGDRVRRPGRPPRRAGPDAAAAGRRDRTRRRGGPVHLPAGPSLAEANAGDLDAAAAHGAAAVRDTESVHTAEAFMANTHVLYAWILEEQDRLAEALDTVGRLATLAAANAESPVAAQIDRWRARAHFAAGHWDEAVVDLDSALRVYDAGQDVWPEPLALRALIAVHRGQLSAPRPTWTASTPPSPPAAPVWCSTSPCWPAPSCSRPKDRPPRPPRCSPPAGRSPRRRRWRWPSPPSARTWPGWPPRPAISPPRTA